MAETDAAGPGSPEVDAPDELPKKKAAYWHTFLVHRRLSPDGQAWVR